MTDKQPLDKHGPGTVHARFSHLLKELEKRFPGVVDPFLSDPPEPKLLKAIDILISQVRDKNNG